MGVNGPGVPCSAMNRAPLAGLDYARASLNPGCSFSNRYETPLPPARIAFVADALLGLVEAGLRVKPHPQHCPAAGSTDTSRS